MSKLPIKVLHISTQDFGGAGKSAVRLAIPMNQYGIESKMLCLIKTIDSDFVVNYKPTIKDIVFKYVFKIRNKILRKVKKISTEGAFSHIRTGLNQRKNNLFKNSDIVNLHWVANFLDYKFFFKNNNKKIVWTLHDMAPFSNGYHYELWDNGNAEDLLKEKIEIMKQVKNLVIVSPSQWLLKKSKESKAFAHFDHYCIPYGLDKSIFKPYPDFDLRKKLNIKNSTKIILFVADQVNDERKGVRFLIDILEKMNSNNKDFFVVTVGSNTGNFVKYKDFMHHFGRVDDEVFLAKIYSAVDLFIIPSIEDNLPNTMIESVMCGTPVVGFNIGGIPDVIKDGENGFLCNDLNSDVLYETINKALDFGFNKQNISQGAHKNFSQEVSVGRYKDLYKKILEI